jgi:glycosyltransferase involved in cell wall biosynthesis
MSRELPPSSGPRLLIHVTTVPMSLLFLGGQLQYMQERGFRPVIVTSPGPGLDRFEEHEPGFPVHAIPMTRQITPWRDLLSLVALYRLFRQLRPWIVHSHTPKAGLLSMVAATIARVPVRIYHLRGMPLDSASGPRKWVLWAAERVTCGLAQRVIAVSHSLRAATIRARLCAPDRVKILGHGSGNGVDAARRFNPERISPTARLESRAAHGIPLDAVVLGFIGRLVPDKGISELVEAWTALKDEFPHVHLLLVGPTEDHNPLPPPISARLEQDDRVHMAGLIWDTPPIYAAMDVVALPSHREGFPNVALEAAAMTLPVVATRVTGCVDAIRDDVTGTLVPLKDPAALADALRRYLRDPELAAHHGEAARRHVVDRFDQRTIWEALCEEYDRLLPAATVND